jgi:hypothetical protein
MASTSPMRHDRGVGAKDRMRRTKAVAAGHRPTAAEEEPRQGLLTLAGAIGNNAMQLIARSPELQGSPAAAGLVSSSAATLARSKYGDHDDDEGVGMGAGTSMDDWLWEQQGWGEQQKARTDAAEEWIIKHANDWPSDAEALPDDEELWRREGVRPFV